MRPPQVSQAQGLAHLQRLSMRDRQHLQLSDKTEDLSDEREVPTPTLDWHVACALQAVQVKTSAGVFYLSFGTDGD